MKLLQTILLPTDFGKGFQYALDTAIALAKAFESEIVLLHTIPDSMMTFFRDVGDTSDIDKRLTEVARQIESRGIKMPRTKIEHGAPAETICREASRIGANLIVLGCHMKRSGNEGRLGVTGERVLQRATTPVWVAKPGSNPIPSRILCPTDFSRASKRALRNALVLCRKLNASLTVLNVEEPVGGIYAASGSSAGSKAGAGAAGRPSEFDRFLDGFDFQGVEWDKELREGTPHRVIVEEVDAQQADLVAMGTVGKTGVERVVMGSVTQKVLRRLPCPVLTMKDEDVIRLCLDKAISSLDEHLKRGQQLLADGLSTEAIREFDECLLAAPTYAVAWDGKAIAYERMGKKEEAESARAAAKRIRDTLWQRRVEAEVRGQHGLFGKQEKSF